MAIEDIMDDFEGCTSKAVVGLGLLSLPFIFLYAVAATVKTPQKPAPLPVPKESRYDFSAKPLTESVNSESIKETTITR